MFIGYIRHVRVSSRVLRVLFVSEIADGYPTVTYYYRLLQVVLVPGPVEI